MTSLVKSEERTIRGERLYADIRDQIVRGRLKAGERLRTSRELQQQFRLSYHATLEALQLLEEEGFLERRPGAGTFVRSAETLRTLEQQARTVRMVVSCDQISRVFIAPLATNLERQLGESGCKYAVSYEPYKGVSLFQKDDADAGVWVATRLPWKLELPPMPVVLVSHDLECIEFRWPVPAPYDIVTSDSRQGGSLAGRHLRETGCKRVAILGAKCSPSDARPCPLTELRMRGFEEGWGEKVPAAQVFLAGDHDVQLAAAMVKSILDTTPRPEAVFATSDDLASGLCHGLVAHHMQPGKDIKVIGFDGQPPRYRGEPVLTSVRAPLEEMGRLAGAMVLERAANPQRVARRVLLACTLRMGATA